MSILFNTQRDETIRRIHRKCAYNSNHIGQNSERMFFAVANHGGRVGKTLFDNPSDYARCIGTVLDTTYHAGFKSRVSTFLRSHTERERDALRELNPTWDSYQIETTGEFTPPTDDAQRNDPVSGWDGSSAAWASQPPSTGLWADYDE